MKIKRILIILVLLIVTFGMVSCNKNDYIYKYCRGEFRIYIKGEYKSKFINKEFEENDFKYKNFLKFEYSWDYDLTNIESVYIYLKKPGKNELKKAIKYYEKNEYVKKVEPIAKLLIG